MIQVTRITKKITRHVQRHKILWSVTGALALLYFIIRIFFTTPLLDTSMFSNAYFDRNGELLRITLTPDEKYRLFVPLNKITPDLARATILYEDKYFYWHIGVNPIALVRAGINHFTPGTRPIGASTITMQVARLIYDMNTRTISGKLKQIAAAIYIDAFHSKDEILTAYLNLAPYGGNIEGIAAASLIYFDKTPDQLSKIESITLSTIPQNPIKRGLNTTSGLTHMRTMRGDLTARWIEQNPSDHALATLADMPVAARAIGDLPFLAPHFTDAEIKRDNINHWGPRQSMVHTTLDMDMQRALQRTLQSQINSRRDIGITNAAAILVNYKTHETLAYIGSADYFDKSIFGENDGVRARRSPGSTLKPLIYAAATDMGLIHPMTLLKDAKINFGVYAPENADNEFYGPVLARDALTHSRNVPAINLVRQIGTKNFYKLLHDSGVGNLRAPEHYGISIALGGAEVSMFELADIYTTMANLGARTPPQTRKSDDAPSITQILSPEAFFLTLDILSHQSTPTHNIPFAKQQSTPIRHYWKTGTSSSFRDAWTAGIFGDYVLIVWVGNFDGRPNNAFSGARTAAPIYFALADTVADTHKKRATPIQNNNFFRDDLNVSRVDMCAGVGGIAGTHCPNVTQSYFIPGVSPIDTSPVYRAIPIDNETGLRACTPDPTTTHMAVFEFWDAEYLDMFSRAGLTRNTPPPFMPDCNLDTIAATRPEMIITSPANNARLVIVTNADTEPVSFQAISDNRTAKIFWFLNDDHIGTSLSGQAFTHPVPMGTHTLRTMDEMGAATTINFSVIK